MTQRPPHHGADGRFQNPWPISEDRPGRGDFWLWMWQRLTGDIPPAPESDAFPVAESRIVRPRMTSDTGESVRLTWVGHATFLIQLPGLNLLTDPMWGERASPFTWIGPRRLVRPGVAWRDLPPIDAVLLSHDHYDHLDDRTVRRLQDRFGSELVWYTPLGYAEWLARRGVRRVVELDWWQSASIVLPKGESGGGTLRALPAQHWTKRGFMSARERLWCSWALEWKGHVRATRIYFAGDSGYCPGFETIGARVPPFDVTLIPIGAYEPRWFMKASHMNPEEAVLTYRDLGAQGRFIPMHWGTFRLTDEDMLEPPVRIRDAWREAGLPDEDLAILRHGETVILDRSETSGRSSP